MKNQIDQRVVFSTNDLLSEHNKSKTTGAVQLQRTLNLWSDSLPLGHHDKDEGKGVGGRRLMRVFGG